MQNLHWHLLFPLRMKCSPFSSIPLACAFQIWHQLSSSLSLILLLLMCCFQHLDNQHHPQVLSQLFQSLSSDKPSLVVSQSLSPRAVTHFSLSPRQDTTGHRTYSCLRATLGWEIHQWLQAPKIGGAWSEKEQIGSSGPQQETHNYHMAWPTYFKS